MKLVFNYPFMEYRPHDRYEGWLKGNGHDFPNKSLRLNFFNIIILYLGD